MVLQVVFFKFLYRWHLMSVNLPHIEKSSVEQHGTAVKVFDSGVKGPRFQFSVENKNFVSIAARSITASDLWGTCSG